MAKEYFGPRQYTENEIRLIRIFLIVIFSFGVFFFINGFFALNAKPHVHEHSHQTSSHKISKIENHEVYNSSHKNRKGKKRVNSSIVYFSMGFVFLLLSGAGILAVRMVIKNGLKDVELDPIKKVLDK